jgi:hypothetical protein
MSDYDSDDDVRKSRRKPVFKAGKMVSTGDSFFDHCCQTIYEAIMDLAWDPRCNVQNFDCIEAALIGELVRVVCISHGDQAAAFMHDIANNLLATQAKTWEGESETRQ